MKVQRLDIPDVILVTPPRFADDRGFFSETYNEDRYRGAGIEHSFVQDNQSLSRQKGVVRGLHCQLAPYEQGKLVRCTQGAIWDVAVDARSGSPTYGQWVGSELSEENWAQLWVPPGFLHGFMTLTDDVMVQYKCTSVYNKASERAVIWKCPHLGIKWPLPESDVTLSEKDAVAPHFTEVQNWFQY